MKQFRILPDALIDWIEQTKNPERYARLILLLIRLANWGDGTYSDGIEVKRGQIRITGRKLAQRLGYSKSAVNRLLLSLQKAGWVELSSQNNLTIISLLWLTQAGHLEAFKRDTQSQKAGHQAGHDKQKEQRATTLHTGHQAGHHKQESGTPESGQAGIRNNKKNIETKEIEKKEEKYKGSNKAPEKGDNVLENSKKQINREIIRNVVEKIASEFKAKYKARFNRYPIIDKASTKRIEEALANSATDFEELKDLSRHLIQKIPDYFKLRDKWVREKGYSWFAFSYRVGDLLSEPVKCQATNTPGVDFKLTLSRI